ncbi:hypothetical protein PUN4_400020 [Paraburkholderia unamae]|nr:hypothetical protein PUN4_400020 [Paraburkholderia unamae]
MRASYWVGSAPEAGCGLPVAEGGVLSSVSGDNESGVPEVSGIVPSGADADDAESGAFAGVFAPVSCGSDSKLGLGGSGGTVGMYSGPRWPQPASATALIAKAARIARVDTRDAAARISEMTRIIVPE